MVGVVLRARPSRLNNERRYAGVARRDQQGLGGVPGRRLDQQPRPAAGGPHGQLEPFVVLPVHQRVVLRRGTQFVPPHLVRPVRLVSDHVEQGPGIGRPGQAVIGAFDALSEIGAGGEVADAELVDLVAVEVDRVGQVAPVRADLAHPQLRVTAGGGRIGEEQVVVQQHLAGAVQAGGPAELLQLLAGHGRGEVPGPALAPPDRLLGGREPRRHLREQVLAQRAQRRGLLVVVGALGGQVLPQPRLVPVAHPGVRVGARAPGRDGRAGAGHPDSPRRSAGPSSRARSGPAGSP